jgi:putative transposase
MIRAGDQVNEWRGKTPAIRSDNGPRYVSSKLVLWAEKHGIRLEYSSPATHSKTLIMSATTG